MQFHFTLAIAHFNAASLKPNANRAVISNACASKGSLKTITNLDYVFLFLTAKYPELENFRYFCYCRSDCLRGKENNVN